MAGGKELEAGQEQLFREKDVISPSHRNLVTF